MSRFPIRSRALTVLWIVVAAALALRLVGLGHELPQHPDEDALIVNQAQCLRSAWAGEPPAQALDPHYPLLAASVLALWPPPAPDAARERERPLEYHLERAALGHRRARLLIALISTLAVPFTWLVARRFLDAPWALFSAALVATSLLHLQLSQAARPHGALASWIALGLWLDLRLCERGRWRDHLAAGAATALALGTLHTGASALLPLFAAEVVRLRRDGRAALPRVLTTWALVALAAWVAYPRPELAGVGAPLSAAAGQWNLSGHLFPASVFDGGGFARIVPLLSATDPVLLALALSGLALALASWARGRARPSLATGILCAWGLPYLIVMGLYGRLPSRFLLPLLPVLALLAGFALQRLAARLGRRDGTLLCALPAFAAALSLALPTYASLRLAWLRTEPEAAQEVARWLAAHAERERDLVYLVASGNLPLLLREEGGGALSAARFTHWDNYLSSLSPEFQAAHAWRTRRLIAGGAGTLRLDEAAVLEVLARAPAEPLRKRFAMLAFAPGNPAPEQAERAVLAAGGRPVFSVEVLAGRPLRHAWDADAGLTLATLLHTRRLGAYTVVYELPEPAGAAGD